MPSILLINDNKIVSRLLQLSSQTHGYSLEEINDYTPGESAYNVIFIDSEKYDKDALNSLKQVLTFDKLAFIGDKTHSKPDEFDFVLEKPFLPTDFVCMMNQNFRVMAPSEETTELDMIDEIEGEDELDLDALEEIAIDDEEDILDLVDVVDHLDDEKIEELSSSIAETETTLTTGIAASMVEEGSKEELANMVNEIDNMEEEEVLEEMDLDALDEDEALESIVDDALVKESLEEVVSSLDEEKEIVEEVSTKEDVDISTVAAGVAATVAVAEAIVKDEEVQEELEDTLNSLDGVEAIEKEEDYLVESEHKVEDLADDFDSLNEKEVENLMAGEEIVSEEFSSGEEKVVESNDLEEMITRAVAKAITKEMLQEALNDMEIVVTLKSKGS